MMQKDIVAVVIISILLIIILVGVIMFILKDADRPANFYMATGIYTGEALVDIKGLKHGDIAIVNNGTRIAVYIYDANGVFDVDGIIPEDGSGKWVNFDDIFYRETR